MGEQKQSGTLFAVMRLVRQVVRGYAATGSRTGSAKLESWPAFGGVWSRENVESNTPIAHRFVQVFRSCLESVGEWGCLGLHTSPRPRAPHVRTYVRSRTWCRGVEFIMQ